MKRLIIFILLASCISIFSYFWIQRVPFSEKFLSEKLHADVTIENVTCDFHHVNFHNIQIKKRKKLPLTFSAENVSVGIKIASLFHEKLTIEKMSIKNGKIEPSGYKIEYFEINEEMSIDNMEKCLMASILDKKSVPNEKKESWKKRKENALRVLEEKGMEVKEFFNDLFSQRP